MNNNIFKLSEKISEENLDGYIVPKNDEFFNEYSYPDRLKSVTNFSGSAGLAVFLKEKKYLFVDGRYTAQAKRQSGKNFFINEIPNKYPFEILKKFKKKLKIGYDPKLFTKENLLRLFKNKQNLLPINNNLVDNVCYNKFKGEKIHSFFTLKKEVAGESPSRKIRKLRQFIISKKIDLIFISAPENVAWLLNLRGSDNPHSPIPNSRLIVTKNEIYLFCNLKKTKNIKKQKSYKNIKFFELEDFSKVIKKIKGKNIGIDKKSCSIFYEILISQNFKIKSFDDPCYNFKSIKNNTEIKNMKKAHIEDGVALTKFLYFIKNQKKISLTEIDAEKKLVSFRRKQKNYIYPSFNTIAGSGPNSAIIHYRSSKKTNRKLSKKELFLVDSGGQYKFGTTDVTRTVCFSNQSNNIKNIFTRVLKGHIGVAMSNISKLKNGKNIDKIARKYLKEVSLDFKHGTGHGVGYFLNVHEGPQAISNNNEVPLKHGMILSNEPGYYKENSYGIRIENLVYIKKRNSKIFFKNLTMAPIDTDLINYQLLDKREKDYLYKYHLEVYNKLSKYLNNKEKLWLKNLIK